MSGLSKEDRLLIGGREVCFGAQFVEVIGDLLALHALAIEGTLQIQAALDHLQLGAARGLELVKTGAAHRPVAFNDDGNFVRHGRTINGSSSYFPFHNFLNPNIYYRNLKQI